MSDQPPVHPVSSNANVPGPEVIREFNDRGTLWLLEDPVPLRDLLQIIEPELAAHLDIERAERVNRSFIPADLQKEESDLIFRVPYRDDSNSTVTEVWIYVLLEHQSRPDLLMSLRILLYMGELWDMQRRAWEDAHLPAAQLRLCPILPVVFYTGTDAWTRPLTLGAMMDMPQALQRFVPQWETLFLNLHRTPPETLTHFATAVGYALRVLHAEQEPLAELERVLTEAMVGLEGLTEEQAGQWLRIAWYLVLLVFHRRQRPEYDDLVVLIREQAKASKFREREEVENVGETMAQWVERTAKSAALSASVVVALEARFGELPPSIRPVLEAADNETLNSWLRKAAVAQSLEEVGITPVRPMTS